MLDKPWREAAALRLSVRTRKEKDGRRTETIKEVLIQPMWQPEYLHHASREGINIRKHGDDLDIATIPREAKFIFWGSGGPDSESHSDKGPAYSKSFPG